MNNFKIVEEPVEFIYIILKSEEVIRRTHLPAKPCEARNNIYELHGRLLLKPPTPSQATQKDT